MPRGHPLRTHELTCIECGEPFISKRSDRLYCSTKCSQRYLHRKNLGAKRAEGRQPRACEECGEVFTPKRSHTRFCSPECGKRTYHRQNREHIRELHQKWVAENPEKTAAIKAQNEERNGERYRANKRQKYAAAKADPEKFAALQAASHEWYMEHREEVIERSARRRVIDPWVKKRYAHGADWESEFERLWKTQGGRCYLCGNEMDPEADRDIHTDHDHSCCPPGRSCEICRRGLACSRCNKLIGHAHDDPDLLRRIADNLEVANAAVRQRMDGALF